MDSFVSSHFTVLDSLRMAILFRLRHTPQGQTEATSITSSRWHSSVEKASAARNTIACAISAWWWQRTISTLDTGNRPYICRSTSERSTSLVLCEVTCCHARGTQACGQTIFSGVIEPSCAKGSTSYVQPFKRKLGFASSNRDKPQGGPARKEKPVSGNGGPGHFRGVKAEPSSRCRGAGIMGLSCYSRNRERHRIAFSVMRDVVSYVNLRRPRQRGYCGFGGILPHRPEAWRSPRSHDRCPGRGD